MSRAANFISFHDLSPEGRILWASPSIFDALGYELEELVGRCGYDIVYPEDYTQGKEFHKESFINDLVASQIVVRYKAKDGRPVHCLCVVSLCYDFAVNSVTILDDAAEACKLVPCSLLVKR
jgi:PAS domain S-box-containing protein